MRVDLEDVLAVATLAEICPEQIVELVFADGAVAAVTGLRADGGVVAAAALRYAAQRHRAGIDEPAWFDHVDHFRLGGPHVTHLAEGVFLWRERIEVAAVLTRLDAESVGSMFAEAVLPGIVAGALTGAVYADRGGTAILRISSCHPSVSATQLASVAVWAASVCADVRRFRATDDLAWTAEGR